MYIELYLNVSSPTLTFVCFKSNMKIKLEFSGGMDLLFGNKKMHEVDLPESSRENSEGDKVGIS